MKKTWYKTDEFLKITGKERSYTRRLKKQLINHPDKKDLIKEARIGTKTQDKFHRSLIDEKIPKYWLVKEEQSDLLEQELKYAQNTIDIINDESNRDSLGWLVYSKSWDLFGTISFNDDKSEKAAYHSMTWFLNKLANNNGNISYTICFAIEPFKGRDGHHIHFVMKYKGIDEHSLLNEFNRYFQKCKLEISKYKKYRAGAFYMTKMEQKGENWDWLTNITDEG